MMTPQEMQDFIQFYEAFQAFQAYRQMNAATAKAPVMDGGPFQQFAQTTNIASQPTANPSTDTSKIAALEAQIASLTTQLATAQQEAQAEKEAAEIARQTAELKAQEAQLKAQKELMELKKKIEKLEKVSGKKIEQLTEDLQKNRKIIPHQGKGAHDAYAEMIDAGKLTRDQADYMDSQDVLDAIEQDVNGEGDLATILTKAEETTQEKMNSGETNQFGF